MSAEDEKENNGVEERLFKLKTTTVAITHSLSLYG